MFQTFVHYGQTTETDFVSVSAEYLQNITGIKTAVSMLYIFSLFLLFACQKQVWTHYSFALTVFLFIFCFPISVDQLQHTLNLHGITYSGDRIN